MSHLPLGAFLIIASIFLLLISQCCSQVTFSRNWEGAGGKRSGHPVIPVPEIYFKIAGNSICQYLLDITIMAFKSTATFMYSISSMSSIRTTSMSAS
ncbi:hypothetical protein HUJ04_006849 [Dendroctonus ponderosae]|nr:hypothetical protein HUJ04_006849 [Dendroctonus ponderosae]